MLRKGKTITLVRIGGCPSKFVIPTQQESLSVKWGQGRWGAGGPEMLADLFE